MTMYINSTRLVFFQDEVMIIIYTCISIKIEIVDTITRKVIFFGVTGGLVVELYLSRNPVITILNPRAIPNPQYPTLSRLKGLRLRLMEPRTFEINCRRGEILFLCKLFIPKTGMETFSDGMRSRVKGERTRRRRRRRRRRRWWWVKVEGEKCCVNGRSVKTQPQPLRPLLFTRFFILILETLHKSKNLKIYENPKIRKSES